MSLHPSDVHILLLASGPALAALVIAWLAGVLNEKRARKLAVADALRQSRLELDLLRRSTEAGIEQLEDNIRRLVSDMTSLRNEIAERQRTTQSHLESMTKEARHRPSPSAFDFRPGAFETLWNKVLKTRRFVAPVLAIYNLPSATDFLPVDERLRHLLPRTEAEDFQNDADELREGTEELRPFLGEDVWQIYSVYYAYALRTAWKVIAGKMSGHVPPWDKDFEGNDDTRPLLSLVLTDEEIATAVGDQQSGAPLRILTALECMMLDTMNVWLFGSPLSHLGLRDREKIAQAALPEIEALQPAPRPSTVSMLGTLRLSTPRYRKSINPRLRAK